MFSDGISIFEEILFLTSSTNSEVNPIKSVVIIRTLFLSAEKYKAEAYRSSCTPENGVFLASYPLIVVGDSGVILIWLTPSLTIVFRFDVIWLKEKPGRKLIRMIKIANF
jgi:hypothetical protein